MLSEIEFMRYISAFNVGDSAAYRAFYAPTISFRNGAGAVLHGPDAIVSYYEGLKGRIARTLEVEALVIGETAVCAALASQFEIFSPREEFAGTTLDSGDRVLLKSVALYELEGSRFARIAARSISRQIVRAGDAR